jgi:hypothetical protein
VSWSLASHLGRLAAEARRDRSAQSLIIANLVTIALALIQRWDIALVMRIYWAQSVIIGFFNFLRILLLKHYTTADSDPDPARTRSPLIAKLTIALFFAFHYGAFHFAYFVFLKGMEVESPPSRILMAIPVAVFGINHMISFLTNVERDAGRRRNLGKLFRYPYIRIVPMHVLIILGAAVDSRAGWLVIFLLLKTVADVVSHELDHTMRYDPPLTSPDPQGS